MVQTEILEQRELKVVKATLAQLVRKAELETLA
jgi:hypothetical protein